MPPMESVWNAGVSTFWCVPIHRSFGILKSSIPHGGAMMHDIFVQIQVVVGGPTTTCLNGGRSATKIT